MEGTDRGILYILRYRREMRYVVTFAAHWRHESLFFVFFCFF